MWLYTIREFAEKLGANIANIHRRRFCPQLSAQRLLEALRHGEAGEVKTVIVDISMATLEPGDIHVSWPSRTLKMRYLGGNWQLVSNTDNVTG